VPVIVFGQFLKEYLDREEGRSDFFLEGSIDGGPE